MLMARNLASNITQRHHRYYTSSHRFEFLIRHHTAAAWETSREMVSIAWLKSSFWLIKSIKRSFLTRLMWFWYASGHILQHLTTAAACPHLSRAQHGAQTVVKWTQILFGYSTIWLHNTFTLRWAMWAAIAVIKFVQIRYWLFVVWD